MDRKSLNKFMSDGALQKQLTNGVGAKFMKPLRYGAQPGNIYISFEHDLSIFSHNAMFLAYLKAFTLNVWKLTKSMSLLFQIE